ncbi:glycosyltransferase, partial [Aduncisulcus paluster]
LIPGYISEAAALLDQNEDSAWVAPKTLFFSTTAIPAWGVPFSFKHALIEPPAVRPSLFRRNAWTSIDKNSLKSEDFESWELWIAFAEQGWTGLHLKKFGVIRNIAHEEALQTVKKKALHNIVSNHPWWFRLSNSTVEINEDAVYLYEQAESKKKKAQAVDTIKENHSSQKQEHGKMRLVR